MRSSEKVIVINHGVATRRDGSLLGRTGEQER